MSAPRNRILSVLFLAIWFMATQHCALEAAGLFASDQAEEEAHTGCCNTNSGGCEADGCKAVEDGQYRSETQSLKAVAPDLTPCAGFLCFSGLVIPAPSEAVGFVEDGKDDAPNWLPSWQFVRRAAAPAHAPDSLSA